MSNHTVKVFVPRPVALPRGAAWAADAALSLAQGWRWVRARTGMASSRQVAA